MRVLAQGGGDRYVLFRVELSRRRGARAAIVVAILGACAMSTAALPASAEPAGGGALRQARAAWDKGSMETAEPLYREAIEKGGLAPTEVLEGYVRLGSIRAALGNKTSALAAFRAASILDASFPVPTEAGPKGTILAAQAKRETVKIGSIQLYVRAPRETPSGRGFKVVASLDAAHVPIVARIGLVARDGTSGKEVTSEARPAENIEFDVPADVTMPNANVLVRVDALDRQGNRIATTDSRVHVTEAGGSSAVASASGTSGSSAGAVHGADGGVRSGGGFWSSPWPYIVGGLALAGAGTAVYFGTRPSDQVTVGQVGVRAR
ncbi:MAG: hypothetical protein JWP97_3119 [Labilithrix sp.]|nr:hypothetical protein [Labilithrix sp.]